MFPFQDHNPSRNTPYVNWVLIAVNIIVFLSYIPILNNDVALSGLFNEWAMVPDEITSGIAFHTVLTSMFLHGGYLHLIGNMLFLWIFGDNVEDAMGHIPYLIFYLVAGFGADIIHIFSDANSVIPTIGASGAIAGVMGAYLLLYPKARVDIFLILVIIFKTITLPAFVVLLVWVALQVFGGFYEPTIGGGIAYWAHIGGFVIGLLLTFPLWLKLGGVNFWRHHSYRPPHMPTFLTTVSSSSKKRNGQKW